MKESKSDKNFLAELDEVPEMDDAFIERFLDHVEKAPKKAISLRVDPLVYSFFKSYGKGYQKRIHAVLQAFVARSMQTSR